MALEMERQEMHGEAEYLYGFMAGFLGADHEAAKRMRRLVDWLA